MIIRIVYRGQIKEKTGCNSEELKLKPGDSLKKSMLEIKRRHGEEVRAMLFDEQGHFRKMMMVVLNGTQVKEQDLERTILKDGDEVMLMSPIAGG